MTDSFFFYLSKLAWLVTNPGILLLCGLVLGVLLLWSRWWKKGRALLLLSVLAAVVIATVPLGAMLLIPLENRFAKPANLPDQVDGILILGGLASPMISHMRGRPELSGGIDRLTEGAELAKRFPNAKVVFTGGTGTLLNQNIKEADVLGPTFTLLNLRKDRLILENQSRNTFENAVFTKEMLKPGTGEAWILVTSAFHMPRAVGVFRRAGWSVIPYPVDYYFAGFEARRPMFNLTHGLGTLSRGVREWLGLIAYRLTDKTARFFPSP